MDLNQVTVPSMDVEKSIEFYKIIGLKLIVNSTKHYARFECPNGSSTFSIQKVKQLTLGDGIHIYFECLNLDKEVLRLKKKGLKFDENPKDKIWLWREAKLRDPYGNQIILYHAGENRLNPPWRIN